MTNIEGRRLVLVLDCRHWFDRTYGDDNLVNDDATAVWCVEDGHPRGWRRIVAMCEATGVWGDL